MSYAGTIIAFPRAIPDGKLPFFDRYELNLILNMYGRLVSTGVVRDYAIEEGLGSIAFCFHKRSSERPAYMIIKSKIKKKKGETYRLMGQGGQILNRGDNLKALLKYFEPKLIKLVQA